MDMMDMDLDFTLPLDLDLDLENLIEVIVLPTYYKLTIIDFTYNSQIIFRKWIKYWKTASPKHYGELTTLREESMPKQCLPTIFFTIFFTTSVNTIFWITLLILIITLHFLLKIGQKYLVHNGQFLGIIFV